MLNYARAKHHGIPYGTENSNANEIRCICYISAGRCYVIILCTRTRWHGNDLQSDWHAEIPPRVVNWSLKTLFPRGLGTRLQACNIPCTALRRRLDMPGLGLYLEPSVAD